MKNLTKSRCSLAGDEVDLEMDERKEILICVAILAVLFAGLALTKLLLVGP